MGPQQSDPMTDIRKYLSKFTSKKMLVVFPHPDDESVMTGGLILTALSMGWEVSVLTLTEGGSGKIFVNGGGRSTREIRREEMATAMSRLGVTDWVMWRFDDGRLRKTKKWRERLRKFMEIMNPDLVVTYDLSGVSGHPDHISLGIEVLRVVRKRGVELLWPSFVGEEKRRMVDGRVLKYLQRGTMKLELSLSESVVKWLAAFSHKSQGLSGFIGMPWWLAVLKRRREYFARMENDETYRYRYVKFRV